MKYCVICGRRITPTFWVCANCEKDHGIDGEPYREWPDWIHELVRTSRREARASAIERPCSTFNVPEGFDPFDYLHRKSRGL